jgi:hypothetical protein
MEGPRNKSTKPIVWACYRGEHCLAPSATRSAATSLAMIRAYVLRRIRFGLSGNSPYQSRRPPMFD